MEPGGCLGQQGMGGEGTVATTPGSWPSLGENSPFSFSLKEDEKGDIVEAKQEL